MYVFVVEIFVVICIVVMFGINLKCVMFVGGWSDWLFGLLLFGGGFVIVWVCDGGNCFNFNGLVIGVFGVYISDLIMWV